MTDGGGSTVGGRRTERSEWDHSVWVGADGTAGRRRTPRFCRCPPLVLRWTLEGPAATGLCSRTGATGAGANHSAAACSQATLRAVCGAGVGASPALGACSPMHPCKTAGEARRGEAGALSKRESEGAGAAYRSGGRGLPHAGMGTWAVQRRPASPTGTEAAGHARTPRRSTPRLSTAAGRSTAVRSTAQRGRPSPPRSAAACWRASPPAPRPETWGRPA